MSPEEKLDLLRQIIECNREALRLLAAQETVLDVPEGDRLPPRARAVYDYVRDAVSPPTRQEIIDALSEDGEGKVAGAGTVNKLITQLVRDGWIKARPRPENGYVVAREIGEK